MNYSIYIFDLYMPLLIQPPPPFTTDAGRWADPKSHSFEGRDDQQPPRNFHIQSQYVNMLGMIGEYWFDDFMSQWATSRGGRYSTFILVRMFDVRWLESPTSITVLTQGLKVFSPALWSANPLVYPFKSRTSDFSCRDDCAPSERREIVGG